MTRTEIIEALQASSPSDKVLLLSLLTYSVLPATVDLEDNDVPAWKNVNDAVISLVTPLRVPFTNETGLTINWQTDVPPGESVSYFTLFNNNVEAFVYFSNSPGGQPYTWTLDGSSNILVVTFDWGISQSGYIKFKI